MSKSTAEIRQAFLEFFSSKGHQIVPSSSLVPDNDPTLLFTNAGMNQFKDVFLGQSQRNYTKATTAQRCLRAGGKHNDLENVGYTARHHTFFEMLGNFSFGDYFKHDAIHYAWELLTSDKWFNLPKEKLLVTVYASDDEAYDIWANDIGVPKERIIRIGDNKGAPYASDNFWQMGDTGPCGPCTEIFYDHGEHLWGGPPGSPEEDGDRFIEIWNVVFMQFNRQSDGTMLPLPKPSVDTGMGLERITAVMQHVNSNYDIDLFQYLIKEAARIIKTPNLESQSLKVIADHIRSCAFLIADGVMPSNEGRGYVLRRIIRRAVRHGNMLGAKEPFFYQLVEPLIQIMGAMADDLKRQKALVEKTLKLEEEQFIRTLERGLSLLDEELAQLEGNVLNGEVVFKLYDTYGFPMDLTADIGRERGIKIDEAGFETAMEAQRRRARESSSFNVDYNQMITVDGKTEFSGYALLSQQSQIQAIFKEGKPVTELAEGDEGVIVLATTPFYAESGGQVGDEGELMAKNGVFAVTDTQKYGQAFGHHGKITSGKISVNDSVHAQVDQERRAAIRLNHSATHLLHAALRAELGEHVAQKGSLVNAKQLRFDFSHPEAMTAEQIRRVEDRVNAQIRRNHIISTDNMSLEQAKEKGAMALFGEKYDNDVRVLTMGDFSIELCGGTHAERTGDIGLFKITSESGIAAGVRRIEAVTGEVALQESHIDEDMLTKLCGLVKSDKPNLVDKVHQLTEELKKFEKQMKTLKAQQAIQESALLINKAIEVNGIKILVSQVDDVDAQTLRTMADELKNRIQSGVVVLGTIYESKVSLIVGVTKSLTSQLKAGEIIKELAEKVDGKGGGRPDMAQAGGPNTAELPSALVYIENLLLAKCEKILS